jgi:hypothetical protein
MRVFQSHTSLKRLFPDACDHEPFSDACDLNHLTPLKALQEVGSLGRGMVASAPNSRTPRMRKSAISVLRSHTPLPASRGNRRGVPPHPPPSPRYRVEDTAVRARTFFSPHARTMVPFDDVTQWCRLMTPHACSHNGVV